MIGLLFILVYLIVSVAASIIVYPLFFERPVVALLLATIVPPLGCHLLLYALAGNVGFLPLTLAVMMIFNFLSAPYIGLMSYEVRQERRRRRGLCVACGYNLRGLPEPRCPECGREFVR